MKPNLTAKLLTEVELYFLNLRLVGWLFEKIHKNTAHNLVHRSSSHIFAYIKGFEAKKHFAKT